MQYRPEIDGLRAIAVLSVIFFHLNIIQGGFIGVDVFFVISGYLITRIIIEEVKNNHFSFQHFYLRRVHRILPALLFILSISLFAGWLLLMPRELKTLSESALSTIFMVSNIYFKRTSDYFSEASELKPLLHTWSLSVEEQFYLIYPLVLVSLLKSRRIATKVTIIALISLALSQWAALTKPISAFYLLWSRLWELLLGALINFTPYERNQRRDEAFTVLGLIFILIPALFYNNRVIFPGVYALFPTLGAALILKYSHHSNWTGRIL